MESGSTEEAREAAAAGADIIMLDNFRPQVPAWLSLGHGSCGCQVSSQPVRRLSNPQALHAAAQALKQEFPSTLIEASGGVIPENLCQYLSPHVDIISLGCITQGCPVVDFSLKVQKPASQPKLQQ